MSENELIENAKNLEKYFLKKGYSAEILKAQDVFSKAIKNPKTLYVVFGSLYLMQEFLKES